VSADFSPSFSLSFSRVIPPIAGGDGLPFETIKMLTSPVIHKGDTYPPIRFEALDKDGNRVSLAGLKISMEFTDAYGHSSVRNATIEPGADVGLFEIPWGSGNTDVAVTWHTVLRFTVAGGVISAMGPDISVYSSVDLWAHPSDVSALAGGSHGQGEIVQAILTAESVVRAWCSRPVASPVPDRVRHAVAILAARALTAVPGGSDDGGIKSERIGDYSVSYVSASATGSPLIVDADVEDLLRPCRPKVYQTDIGPEDSATAPGGITPQPYSVSPT